MSNYETKTLAQRKAWGKKMAAARAAKAATISGKGAYYRKDKATGQFVRQKKSAVRARVNRNGGGGGDGYSSVGTALGSALGTAIGGPGVGTAIGGLLGNLGGGLAGEAIKYFTGKGDYKVINNSLMVDDPALVPIHNSSKGGDVYRRSEYLDDIISSSSANTFKLQNFFVNPGLESTFEWLSQIACNYEEYEFEGIYFEFRSMSADALNSVNTALGQVIMAANYNSASPNFTNKQTMENYEGGVSGKPSCSIRYFVECARSKTVLDQLYVRQGAVPTGQDQRLYDLCNFQIATNGMQGTNVNVGELWVVYQVRLLKPKMFAALGLYNSYTSVTPVTGSYANALPLGDVGSWNFSAANNIIGFKITGTTMSWSAPTIPQGYELSLIWSGTGAVSVMNPPVVATNGLTLLSDSAGCSPGATSAITSLFVLFSYNPDDNLSGADPTLTFGTSGTLPTGTRGLSIELVQAPNTIFGI